MCSSISGYGRFAPRTISCRRKTSSRFIPLVKDYLASSEPEFWVVSSADGAVMGFMGLSGSKMEALFLAPEFRGRGAGRLLVQHARTLRGELTTDVNEQNHAARRFYEGCGFVVEGRSELDDMGRPYPLLHMRLKNDQRSHGPQPSDPQSQNFKSL